MARYYDGHETVYRELREKGHRTWGEPAGERFEAFFYRPFLERVIAAHGLAGVALELGCGTGPGACFLAERGFSVTGIDISATAIELAREHAAERGLGARFEVGDVCALSASLAKLDLIVDGHCLHCIVFDDERAALLRELVGRLRGGGRFAVSTMALADSVRFDPSLVCDEDGVVWWRSKVTAHEIERAKEVNGVWWVPQRRLKPAAALRAELVAAGFAILEETLVVQGGGDPPMYQALAGAPG
jgi:SAM-dependent methyltransferase